MKKKDINDWFKSLDSYELSFLFPCLYREHMESADPKCNINTFIKEVNAEWKAMSDEEKETFYNTYNN